jgi:hypothetical protein
MLLDGDVIWRSLLYNAILFIILHEVAHVTCGHFLMAIDAGIAKPSREYFTFSEIKPDATSVRTESTQEDSLASNMVRLTELEADAVAFDVMLALSYELLIGNSEVSDI